MPSDSHNPDPPTHGRKWRWWIPIAIVIAVASSVTWFYATEHTLRTHALQIFSALGLILIAFWYIFLSGQPGRKKWILSTIFAAFAGIVGILGANGWIRPKLADGSGWFTLEFGPAREPLPELEPTGDIPGAPNNDDPLYQVEARFLGPLGDGKISGAPLVTDWEGSPPQELWRRQLGSGWASFAVAAGKAVTLEQRDKEELTVCYALETGDPLWVSKNNVRFEESMGGPGPRATPTIAEGSAFSLGATGTLKCLNLDSGDEIWSKNVLGDPPSENLMYGKSSAPLIHGENVIVSGGKNGPTLLALNRSSGELT